ncbi:MAG: ABC transporter permease [Ginsengibacter sp.]
MFKNYFKTAFRNLKRNKSYALINTLGLAVGVGACFLIFLVVQFESSFDNFHPKKDNIYRVGSVFNNADGISYNGGVGFPVANALRIDFPQIKGIASIDKEGGQITVEGQTRNLKKLQEENFYYAEPQFFSMFNFGWLAGDPKTSLNNPNNAVLTQATAEKFFGDWKAALGKTIKYENKDLYTITGILKNPPHNTDFPLSIVVPYSALEHTNRKSSLNDWVSTFSGAYTFVVLPEELSAAKFNTELKVFAKKHKPAEESADSYIAQPLSEIHYDEQFGNYNYHTFSHSLIYALSLIGIFLIIIACINFINLATAQGVNRSKEVGVRKVLGSNRRQLALQFLGETAVIVIFAIILALILSALTLPFLNRLLETQISFSLISNPSVIVFLLSAAILVTLLAGIYPAIILSGFNPITALKSKVTTKMVGGISLRRGLVVMQFAIAQILIIGMIIVVGQMNFFKNASLGFNKDNIINVPIINDSINLTKTDYLRNQLLNNPDIKNVSFSYGSPSDNGGWQSDFKFDHSTKSTNFNANLKWADPEYFKTYNLQFVAGHAYSNSDTVREFVVNETLLKKLGITDPQKAIGKQINFWDETVANIVGVIKDFNSYSLRDPISPVVLSTRKQVYRTINIKIKAGSEKTALPYIEKLWTSTYPDYVYDYKFLDAKIESFYKQEDQLSQLYKIFAGIAIFISCLGLYGLVSFMAVQRTKEMGIRKVLGASVSSIVYLLSKEFTVLIMIAFTIAAPVSYFIMNKWLQNYTYRIPLGASVFILAIVSSVIIAWITVGYRAIKTARANPVESLRSE